MSEQIAPHQSLLPPLPPADTFSHPVYAALAKKFWEDETLIELPDALAAAAQDMNPQELLGAAQLLDKLGAAYDDDCGHATLHEWTCYDPATATVDDEGLIHAVIGRASDVRIYLQTEDNRIVQEFIDDELDDAYFRSGYDPVTSVSSLIDDEEFRREALARSRKADAEKIANAPKLFSI